jgi:hypothetical protein
LVIRCGHRHHQRSGRIHIREAEAAEDLQELLGERERDQFVSERRVFGVVDQASSVWYQREREDELIVWHRLDRVRIFGDPHRERKDEQERDDAVHGTSSGLKWSLVERDAVHKRSIGYVYPNNH